MAFDKRVNKTMKEKEKNNSFLVDSECQLKGNFSRVPVHKAFFAKMNAHLRVQRCKKNRHGSALMWRAHAATQWFDECKNNANHI